MGIFGKKEEVKYSDPLVTIMTGLSDKISKKNRLTEYDIKFIDMVEELMELDMKHCIEKSSFVVNFLKNEKYEGKGYNIQKLTKELEKDLDNMKVHYEACKKVHAEKKE